MTGGRWTKELEVGLAKLYKKFRCLWSSGLPAYNDLDRRYAAYVKIVEALRPEFRSLTVPKVVYKIRDLRYRYCVELTKIERAAACGENYTPDVAWFRVMHSFLDLRFRTEGNKDCDAAFSSGEKADLQDYSGTRLTSSTCQTIYENRLKMEKSRSTVGEFEESDYSDVCDRIRRSEEAEESDEVREAEVHPESSPLEMKISRKLTETLLAAGGRKWNYEIDETTNEFDEFNAFALSVGSQLKTLDPALIEKLEIMILTILNEERIRSMQ